MTFAAAALAFLAAALSGAPASRAAPPAPTPLRSITHRLIDLLPDALVKPPLGRRAPLECVQKQAHPPFRSRYSTLPEELADHHQRVTLSGGGAGRIEFRDTLLFSLPRTLTFEVVAPEAPRLELAYRLLRCKGKATQATMVVTVEDSLGVTTQRVPLIRKRAVQGTRWRELALDLPIAAGQPARITVSFQTNGAGLTLAWAEPVITGAAPPPHEDNDRNVLLIIIDAVRSDVMGPGRRLPSVTPNFDRIFDTGTSFRRAYSVANQTRPSTLAMLQSQPPSIGRYHARSFAMTKRVKRAFYANDPPLITRHLAERGWRVATFGRNHFLWDDLIIGLDHGYDHAIDFRAMPSGTPAMTAEAVAFMTRHKDDRWFLAVNYTAPHTPYNPPEGYIERVEAIAGPIGGDGISRQYLAEVAFVDHEVQPIFDALARLGLDERTLVVVTADHGELMYSHHACYSGRFQMPCQFSHGLTVYDEELHVPLALRLPGAIKADRTIREPVSHLDLAPTILDLLGLPPVERHVGRSLVPLLRGEGLPGRPIYSEGRLAVAFQHADLKLIVHAADDDIAPRARTGFPVPKRLPRHELYDLSVDPLEHHNLTLVDDPREQMMLTELDLYRRALSEAGQGTQETSEAPLSAAMAADSVAWNVLQLAGDGTPRALRAKVLSPRGQLACKGKTPHATCSEEPGGGLSISLTAAGTERVAVSFESTPWGAPLDLRVTLDEAPLPLDRLRVGPYGLALLEPGQRFDAPERLALAAGRQAPRTKTGELGAYFWRSPLAATAAGFRPEDQEGGFDADDEIDAGVRKYLQEQGYIK